MTGTSWDDQVVIRAITPGDREALRAFFGGLSPDSLYTRFHRGGQPSETELRDLTTVDHVKTERLVALELATGRIIGEAGWGRLRPDDPAADVGIVVAEDWRRRGVATRLMADLAALAGGCGIERFTATVRATNRPVIESLKHRGAAASHQGSAVELVLPVEALRRKDDQE
jgi:acetate---CoA ligase (ADP-forming)